MIGFSMDYYIFMAIGGVMSLVGMFIGNRLKSKAKKYSRIPLRAGLSGRDIAEKMLRDNDIFDVKIVEGRGFLTDHYNPTTKTVSLSPAVYHGKSIMSAAVSAHEVGHAVQHDQAYSMLQVRSALVPVVQFSSMIQQWVLLGAFMLANSIPQLLLVAIAVFGVTALFAIVTLPVEFDATKRGLQWLRASNISQGKEFEGAKDALKWAAMTYVAAALSALVMLLYLILRYQSRD